MATILEGASVCQVLTLLGEVKHTTSACCTAAALGMGFVSSGIAFLWNFSVIDRAGSLIAASTMYFIPFVAIALGIIFLGEQVLWNQVLGAIIIIFAAIVGQGRLGRLLLRR